MKTFSGKGRKGSINLQADQLSVELKGFQCGNCCRWLLSFLLHCSHLPSNFILPKVSGISIVLDTRLTIWSHSSWGEKETPLVRELEQSYSLAFVSIFVIDFAYTAKLKTSIKIHGFFSLFFFLSNNSAGINIIKRTSPSWREKKR